MEKATLFKKTKTKHYIWLRSSNHTVGLLRLNTFYIQKQYQWYRLYYNHIFMMHLLALPKRTDRFSNTPWLDIPSVQDRNVSCSSVLSSSVLDCELGFPPDTDWTRWRSERQNCRLWLWTLYCCQCANPSVDFMQISASLVLTVNPICSEGRVRWDGALWRHEGCFMFLMLSLFFVLA